ncbi:hypothetical protein PVK06_049916 [Gossypium arboreum]|uniref:Uncharacterized protein n=1 Tax=Gossypium arboreum TaxID=29729 RepID=A0ABR0M9D8_GOSAR|nr:hypothetical protein PVK06_049916 [Gossypium arboreum]
MAKGWSTIRAFFKRGGGRTILTGAMDPNYGGIFHCSTCAIDRLRSRPRSNGSHFGYVREKRSLPHSLFRFCQSLGTA